MKLALLKLLRIINWILMIMAGTYFAILLFVYFFFSCSDDAVKCIGNDRNGSEFIITIAVTALVLLGLIGLKVYLSNAIEDEEL